MEIRTAFRNLVVVIMAGVILGLSVPVASQGSEPQPGDIINAGNVEQYKDYFPNSLVQIIQGKTEFTVRPVNIKVGEVQKYLPPKAYMEWSEKNKGKFTLDAEGNLQGDHQAGLPFMDPEEPNLAQKVMWNFYYRWRSDQWHFNSPGWRSYAQRKNGRMTSTGGSQFYVYFANRTEVDPKPEIPNSKGLFFSFVQHYFDPPNKDLDILVYRYKDPAKSDDMWAYIPTLRRTLRMVSSERANPVQGSPATWDDFYGFDGKLQEFSYSLVNKQKYLGIFNQVNFAKSPKDPYDHMIFDKDPWELWNHYMIEIKPKNPRYPESKRYLWVSEDIYMATGAESFDKTGNLWKAQSNGYGRVKTPTEESGPWMLVTSFIDFKTTFWNGVINNGQAPPMANSPIDVTILDPGYLGQSLPFD